MTSERSVVNVFMDNPEGVRVHYQIVEGTTSDQMRVLALTADRLIEANIANGYSAATMQERGARRSGNGATTDAPQEKAQVCANCGSDFYDNRKDKRSDKAPDTKCKNKDCQWVGWFQKDGSIKWQAPRI